MKAEKELLFVVGANHNSAEIDFREELFLNPEELDAAIPVILQRDHLKEMMALSTCNRLEIYGVTNETVTDDDIAEIYIDLQRTKKSHDPASTSRIKDSLYVFRHGRAVEHMFSVCSGLDSLVLGETQITGQFKDASVHAKKIGTLGSILDRVVQDALACSKKIRTHTDIGKKPVSISHAAIDLANRVYGKISEHRILIIGAGEMARVAAQNVVKYNPKKLFLVNRTLAKAQALVDEIGMGDAYSLDNLTQILAQADIVISSTAADKVILNVDLIEKTQFVRQHRPLFLIDIALPRDIDPCCGDLEDIYLFDIDDLKQVVGEHIEERRLAAEKAKGMIVERAMNFMKWMDSLAIKPALSGFREYLDDLVKREVERTLNKGPLAGLNEAQISSIQMLLQSVVGKITSDASIRVKAPPEGFFQEQLAAALKVLFPRPQMQEQVTEE